MGSIWGWFHLEQTVKVFSIDLSLQGAASSHFLNIDTLNNFCRDKLSLMYNYSIPDWKIVYQKLNLFLN